MLDLIKERRSVRLFTEQKISEKELIQIVEAGSWAPTGCNNQELSFVVLESRDALLKMAEFKPLVKSASHVLLLFIDMELPGSKELYTGVKHTAGLPFVDAGLALGNICLFAKSKGIDSCIFNMTPSHMKRKVKRNLLQKMINKTLKILGNYKQNKASFYAFQSDELNLADKYKVCCGVALGYGKVIPDIETFGHGYNPVKRRSPESYILKRS